MRDWHCSVLVPMVMDYLQISESVKLSFLNQEINSRVRIFFGGHPFDMIRALQFKNAFLAKSLVATDWRNNYNLCGLQDCRKPTGLWLPLNGGGYQHPAPTYHPQRRVATHMELVQNSTVFMCDSIGPCQFIVTCSLSCCLKAWNIRNVMHVADNYLSLIHISEPTRPY